MKIVLDNTKEIEVGSFTETMDEFGNNLHAINLVSVNDQTQFPTVPQLDGLGFTTIKIINDNQVEIPENEDLIKVLFKKNPEEIKENKDKIKNTVKNANKKTLTIIPIIAGIILAFLAIILKKRNNKTKLQKENNPSHNMDLTKIIPDTFKAFKN